MLFPKVLCALFFVGELVEASKNVNDKLIDQLKRSKSEEKSVSYMAGYHQGRTHEMLHRLLRMNQRSVMQQKILERLDALEKLVAKNNEENVRESLKKNGESSHLKADAAKGKAKPKPLPVGKICTKGSIGGSGGNPFDDKSVASGKGITGMKIVCGSNHVVQILIRYNSTWVSHPSGVLRKGGRTLTYDFDDDEYITSVNSKSNNFIRQMTITTNKRQLPKCVTKQKTGSESTIAGRRLMYISGRSGGIIDRLTFHWVC